MHTDMHDAQMLQAIQTDADSETEKFAYQSADTEVKEYERIHVHTRTHITWCVKSVPYISVIECALTDTHSQKALTPSFYTKSASINSNTYMPLDSPSRIETTYVPSV